MSFLIIGEEAISEEDSRGNSKSESINADNNIAFSVLDDRKRYPCSFCDKQVYKKYVRHLEKEDETEDEIIKVYGFEVVGSTGGTRGIRDTKQRMRKLARLLIKVREVLNSDITMEEVFIGGHLDLAAKCTEALSTDAKSFAIKIGPTLKNCCVLARNLDI